MKIINKFKETFNIKNLVKGLFAFSFSCFYLVHMKLGADICEIDEKYCTYFCCGILFYFMFRYLYNLTCKFVFTKDEKDGETL